MMVVSTNGRMNGMGISTVARHYSEEKLPARYLPKKAKKSCSRKGRDNGKCIINAEQVYAIRQHCEVDTYRSVAEKFGISESYCRKIHKRMAWTHLPERKA